MERRLQFALKWGRGEGEGGGSGLLKHLPSSWDIPASSRIKLDKFCFVLFSRRKSAQLWSNIFFFSTNVYLFIFWGSFLFLKMYKFIYFNWSLITLQYCMGGRRGRGSGWSNILLRLQSRFKWHLLAFVSGQGCWIVFFKNFNRRLITLQYCMVIFAIHWHESAMVYMCPPLWIPFPLPSSLPFHPSGLSQCTSFECPVSRIELGLVICFTYGNIHVSMLFSQIIPPSPSSRVQKSVLYIRVSFAVLHLGRC